jgi:hypothetical protein
MEHMPFPVDLAVGLGSTFGELPNSFLKRQIDILTGTRSKGIRASGTTSSWRITTPETILKIIDFFIWDIDNTQPIKITTQTK